MMVPPLSERPVTEEDEEQFRRESAPRKYTLWERWSDYRADVKRTRPKGAKARFRAWMDADAVDWGIRVAIVFLFIGGSYSLYINGVAYGWWHAWGEKPTVAATTTPAAAFAVRIERTRHVRRLRNRPRRRPGASCRACRLDLHPTRTTRRSQRKHRKRSRTRRRACILSSHICLEYRRYTTIRRYHRTWRWFPSDVYRYH